MEVVEFGTEISLERCSGCHGLYCEREILARMRDEWLTETVLDTGCAAEGARHNDMRISPWTPVYLVTRFFWMPGS
jgi:hypothetical protein